MSLRFLVIGVFLAFTLLPFTILPPAQAVGELYWVIPVGIVGAAAAFKSFALVEKRAMDGGDETAGCGNHG